MILTLQRDLDRVKIHVHVRLLGRNRFAKPNRNRFQIFGFYAIDLSNLKPVFTKPAKPSPEMVSFAKPSRDCVVIVFCWR